MNNESTFPKREKLCSEKAIEKLFSYGSSFIAYPLRIVFFTENEPDKALRFASVLTSVSKKKFKRAVKRNRIKRLIREAYRLNKSNVITTLEKKGQHMDIAFLYLSNELPEYKDIEKAMLKAIAILTDKLTKECDGGN